MSYGKGIKRIGDICHSSTDFPNVYSMTFEDWLKRNRVRMRNEYYEECATFCRHPVIKA